MKNQWRYINIRRNFLVGLGIILVSSGTCATELFQLPFEGGETHKVSQGQLENSHATFAKEHYAVDYTGWSDIKATRSGVVVNILDTNSAGVIGADGCTPPDTQPNYLVIKHSDNDNANSSINAKETLYLHLQRGSALAGLNQYVLQGEPIGTMGNVGHVCGSNKGTHLHFQVQSICDGYYCTSMDFDFKEGGSKSFGATTVSENYLPKISGQGSLIAPSMDKFGANKDVVPVFANQKNLAVFQWLYDEANCVGVDVKLLDNNYNQISWAGNAYIHSGYWNSILNPGTWVNDQFYVTLLPASIGYPTSKNNPFGVFSVQLDSLPKTDGLIMAQCVKNRSVVSSGKNYNRPGYIQRYNVGIPLRYKKAWTGSGSIISHLDASLGMTQQFGKNIDYAMVLRDGTSHATFQWSSSSASNCSHLVISGKSASKADVAIKIWDRSEFVSLGTVTLPYTVNAISGDNFYIISVKPESLYQSGVDYITAKCLL